MHNSVRRQRQREEAARRSQSFGVILTSSLLLLITHNAGLAQIRSYPKEIRGYKVERTVVELKNPGKGTTNTESSGERPRQVGATSENAADRNASTSDSKVDQLIQFGKPSVASVTPLGISLEIPIVVAPVQQKGHVDFLVFEDMVVNDTPVEIAEFRHSFDLPNRDPLTLREPLSFYIYLPRVVLAGIDDWINAKESWPVTGRVYVFGKFKKTLFSFKRCIPVELNLTMRNPRKE